MRIVLVLALVFAFASAATAATVTIDLNGFPNLSRGQVTGPGLAAPIILPAKADKVELKNLQPGGIYLVDFFHNSGEYSSDFSFMVNDDGTGVSDVSRGGGGRFTMLTGFRRGDDVLKLAVFDIVMNANSAQKGEYYVNGAMEAHTLGQNSTPQTLKLIPGWYAVDNLYNTNGGEEDYQFLVNSKGEAKPFHHSDEDAVFDGNQIKPRAALVHYKIVASIPINYQTTHPTADPKAKDNVYEFDMDTPIGGGGVNVWSFGECTVTKSNVTLPDTFTDEGHVVHHKLEGWTGTNDFLFSPLLRYDLVQQAFYFQTPDRAEHAMTAHAEATGKVDGGEQPLTVTIDATIVKPAATQ